MTLQKGRWLLYCCLASVDLVKCSAPAGHGAEHGMRLLAPAGCVQ